MVVWGFASALFIVHGVLWRADYIGGGMALSSLGIVFDILGACILVWSSLKKYLASFRFVHKQDRSLPQWRHLDRWILQASRVIGPRDPVAATNTGMRGESADLGTGLSLLLLGFLGQLAGLWLSQKWGR